MKAQVCAKCGHLREMHDCDQFCDQQMAEGTLCPCDYFVFETPRPTTMPIIFGKAAR